MMRIYDKRLEQLRSDYAGFVEWHCPDGGEYEGPLWRIEYEVKDKDLLGVLAVGSESDGEWDGSVGELASRMSRWAYIHGGRRGREGRRGEPVWWWPLESASTVRGGLSVRARTRAPCLLAQGMGCLLAARRLLGDRGWREAVRELRLPDEMTDWALGRVPFGCKPLGSADVDGVERLSGGDPSASAGRGGTS